MARSGKRNEPSFTPSDLTSEHSPLALTLCHLSWSVLIVPESSVETPDFTWPHLIWPDFTWCHVTPLSLISSWARDWSPLCPLGLRLCLRSTQSPPTRPTHVQGRLLSLSSQSKLAWRLSFVLLLTRFGQVKPCSLIYLRRHFFTTSSHLSIRRMPLVTIMSCWPPRSSSSRSVSPCPVSTPH